ncbi:MAG: hypothetical protein GY697_13185, partial [Desulfobacterales bacterium]|nr:hypothetical protein [Desulfobacterales bacterium]
HQANPGGVPCFAGHYEDVSKRTVDLRDADRQKGHFHPKRVLLFTPPPTGFFPFDQKSIDWLDRLDPANEGLYSEITSLYDYKVYVENGEQVKLTVRIFRNPATADLFEEEEQVREFADNSTKTTRIFKGRNPDSPLKINGAIEFMTEPAPDQEMVFRFEDLYLRNTITVKYGRLETKRVAAFRTWVQNADKQSPVLTAEDSLIQHIRVARGLCQLEYCTILESMVIEKLQASDCILLERFEKDLEATPLSQVVCIRYSAIAKGLGGIPGSFNCTEATPLFYSKTLGEPGCGVLKTNTLSQISFGSEDGSEMGAFHHRHYCLSSISVTDKLEDFLPVGIKPVIIPDIRLWVTPP